MLTCFIVALKNIEHLEVIRSFFCVYIFYFEKKSYFQPMLTTHPSVCSHFTSFWILYGMFGLMNDSILDEAVHHESIYQFSEITSFLVVLIIIISL
jgi:hypothetical protein